MGCEGYNRTADTTKCGGEKSWHSQMGGEFTDCSQIAKLCLFCENVHFVISYQMNANYHLSLILNIIYTSFQERGGTLATCCEAIDFQSEQVSLLVQDTNFPHDLGTWTIYMWVSEAHQTSIVLLIRRKFIMLFSDVGYLLKAWSAHKKVNILTYRDQVYESKFSKEVSPVHPDAFMKCFDDSLEAYLNKF